MKTLSDDEIAAATLTRIRARLYAQRGKMPAGSNKALVLTNELEALARAITALKRKNKP